MIFDCPKGSQIAKEYRKSEFPCAELMVLAVDSICMLCEGVLQDNTALCRPQILNIKRRGADAGGWKHFQARDIDKFYSIGEEMEAKGLQGPAIKRLLLNRIRTLRFITDYMHENLFEMDVPFQISFPKQASDELIRTFKGIQIQLNK